MRISIKLVVGLFLLALLLGIAGVAGTSALMTDRFEATSEGQALLQMNIEVAAAVLAIAFGALALLVQQRAADRVVADTIDRRLTRIVTEVGSLLDTLEQLEADPTVPTRFIWRRSAWAAAERYFGEHLDVPGLFYALENFYMAADALRDADHDRARYIWNHGDGDADTIGRIVTRHTTNLLDASRTLSLALADAGHHVPTARLPGT